MNPTSNTLSEFQRMIYAFGMHHDSDSATGHPDKCWQMNLAFEDARCMAYGRTPEEVCTTAIKWLKEKGWWEC